MANHQSFAQYRSDIARQLAEMQISENAVISPEGVAAVSVDEYLAQSIWLHSFFLHQNLKTDDGQPLEIIHPGAWNRSEGPDFQSAKLRIGNRVVTGDVEIHLYASGWRQHRHHLNPIYDSVVLHAYLWRDGGAGSPACHSSNSLSNNQAAHQAVQAPRNSKGEPIASFEMAPVLFTDLDTIRQTVHVEDYPASSPSETPAAWGKCQQLMATLDDAYIEGFLHAAARDRMESKARRYHDQASGETLDQVFYQALMTAMGLRSSKSLFFLLSKRTPVQEMRDYAKAATSAKSSSSASDAASPGLIAFFQSILLNVPQMVPPCEALSGEADPEALEYAKRLRQIWQRFSDLFSDRLIPPTKRWNTGIRPVNFAQRRLAGIAHLLARWFMNSGNTNAMDRFAEMVRRFNGSLPLKARRQWIDDHLVQAFLVDAPEDFWAWHYTFPSKRTPRPMMLIGEERARSIALNALLPVLLVHARRQCDRALEDRLWEIFFAFPPLESNSVVRHMQTRLFGNHRRAKTLFTTEARQQALFQIFAECCNLNERTCEDCYYFQLGQSK